MFCVGDNKFYKANTKSYVWHKSYDFDGYEGDNKSHIQLILAIPSPTQNI